MAAKTNYYSSLKTMQICYVRVLEARNQNGSYGAGGLHTVLAGGEYVSLLFQLLGTCVPGLVAPSCITLTTASTITSPSLTLLPSSHKGPGDNSGPTWIIQTNLPISRFFLNHTCKVLFNI